MWVFWDFFILQIEQYLICKICYNCINISFWNGVIFIKQLSIILCSITLIVMLIGCNNITNNSKYVDPEGKSYKYKLELSGIMPNSKKETTLIILANDNTLTFDDVSKSLYSSNSKDSESVDFYLLSTE